jgi:hypothetical protein
MTEYRYRWVRTRFWFRTPLRGTCSGPDNLNVGTVVSQGWEPVPVTVADWPNGTPTLLNNDPHLVLYRLPEAKALEHEAQLKAQNDAQQVQGEEFVVSGWKTGSDGKPTYLSDSRDEVLAKLEDFYSPLYCALDQDRIAEANVLLRSIDMPEWTTAGLRKELVAYWKRDGGPFRAKSPYYFSPGSWYDKTSRQFRREWRMPISLSERWEFFLDRLFKRPT